MGKTQTWAQIRGGLRLPWTRILAVLAGFAFLTYWNHEDKDAFHEEMKSMELEDTNAFIHSAYFYRNSKSLGKNAVAIVATMSRESVKDLDKYKVKIVGTNSTDRFVTEGKITTEHDPDDSCAYTAVLIQTNTVKYMSKLEIEMRNGLFTIPILKPMKSAPKPVVFCIAPLFAAEQWQSLLMQLHVTKKFGAHLHVYMTTLVEYYYQLARELGELEMITTQPWLSVKFSQVESQFLEPNRNLELRNPAAAYTDCLLQYKEAAQFVGFMEIEDLLFPLNANTYYEEFEREYEGSFMISALYYQVLDQQSEKSSDPSQQSIGHFVGNANQIGQAKLGRVVVRPERYNSTWTHYSTQADKQPIYLTEQQEEPHFMARKEVKTNAVLSFKKMETVVNATESDRIPMHPISSDQKLLSEEQMREIDADIQTTLSLPTIEKIAKHLPTEDYYTQFLNDCLAEQKYGKDQCVNTRGCVLPNNGSLVCRHSDGLYHSGRLMHPFTYHFATEPYFTRNLGCYE